VIRRNSHNMLVRQVSRAIKIHKHAPRVRYFGTVSSHEAIKLQREKKGFFVDVCPPAISDYEPKGFTRIPYRDIEKDYVIIPKGDPVYVIDSWGYYSERVATFLESKGYNVSVINGGVLTWACCHGPMEWKTEELQKLFAMPEGMPNFNQFKSFFMEQLDMEIDYSKIIPPDIEYKFATPEQQQQALKEALKYVESMK